MHDAAARRRVERAVLGLVAREHLALVPGAELGGAGEHHVLARVAAGARPSCSSSRTRSRYSQSAATTRSLADSTSACSRVGPRGHRAGRPRSRPAAPARRRGTRTPPVRTAADGRRRRPSVGLRPFYQRPPTRPRRPWACPCPGWGDSCRRAGLPYCSRRTSRPDVVVGRRRGTSTPDREPRGSRRPPRAAGATEGGPMAVRFVPPPGWPVPEGFTPTTEWHPDPSWPPPRPGGCSGRTTPPGPGPVPPRRRPSCAPPSRCPPGPARRPAGRCAPARRAPPRWSAPTPTRRASRPPSRHARRSRAPWTTTPWRARR